MGLVHFVTISSEIPFDFPDLLGAQWNWLNADLAQANANRSEAPWIVVHAHRSIYCSCDGDCDGAATTFRAGIELENGTYVYGTEQLLYEHGVDLFINGHEHNVRCCPSASSCCTTVGPVSTHTMPSLLPLCPSATACFLSVRTHV